MRIGSRPRLVPLLWWLFFLALSIFSLLDGGRELSGEIASYGWEATQGRLRERERTGRGFFTFHYGYRVRGGDFEGAQRLMWLPLRATPEVGAGVTVHYHPEEPSRSVIVEGIRVDGGIPLIFVALLIQAGLAAVALVRLGRGQKIAAFLHKLGTRFGRELAERDAPRAAVVAAVRKRLSPPARFEAWGRERWAELERQGPLAVAPAQRAFAPRLWSGRLDVHALLYPRERFADAADYLLFVRYTSTIQQFVARGEAFEVKDWFAPGKGEQQVADLGAELRSQPPPRSGPEIRAVVAAWKLPPAFGWMERLRYEAGWVKPRGAEVEMTAVAAEGYLSFFSLPYS